MRKIVAHLEEHRGYTRELSLNFDDDALATGSLHITAEVAQWPTGNELAKQVLTASVSIEQDDDDRPVLVVRLSGEVAEVGWKEDVLKKPLWEIVEADQVLDWIPAWAYTGDPITGCMVRSGLSALVGQLLDCRRSTSELPWFKKRMLKLSRCMLEHVPDMAKTAGLRAAKCVWSFGF
jgi:hypothetical protein